MRKYCLLFILVTIAGLANAQRHMYIGLFGGLTNYKGDLGSSIALSKPNGVGGFSMIFELNHRMLIRTEFNYGKLHGSDGFSSKTRSRNLDFSSKISEAALQFEYVLFDLYDYKVSPYVFAGLATFKFSPYTFDSKGNIIMLAEQSTEGQGFYKDRKDYKLQKLSIPFGGGLQWALSPRQRIAFEVGIRKTNTDYLDDVSTTYVDQNLLSQKRGGTASSIAFRGDEIAGGNAYPVEGTQRGNPDNKDWYMFSGISYRFSLQPRPRQRVYKYKPRTAKTSCPQLY
ncbi:MAG: hypothetical protein EOO06_04720 [Chitinophagaceae bacterium]|nr:MAG: hypothetical protein EOO06_04720 [Chitinophagaceae bacterium]